MNFRFLLAAIGALALTACPTGPSTSDAGDAGDDENLTITVTGTTSVWPHAVGYLADAGQTLTLTGLLARVEEPLKVALGDDAGVFGENILTTAGTYSVSNIKADRVTLGIAVGILEQEDAGTQRVARAATVVFDVTLEQGRPRQNIPAAVAYALPKSYHDALTAAVGVPFIQMRTTGNPKTDLLGAGFILGQVVDASGKPVAGATITSGTTSSSGFVFPKDDFSGTQTSTASHGLFVYVHNGSTVTNFKFRVAGTGTTYRERNAGAVKEAGLLVIVSP